MSQGGSSPPNLRGAFQPYRHQRSASESQAQCDHVPPLRPRGRTFNGRQPEELFLPSTIPERNPERQSPNTPITPPREPIIEETSVSPPLSRSNSLGSRNPYNRLSGVRAPSPIEEQPQTTPQPEAPAPPPKADQPQTFNFPEATFSHQQWTTVNALIARATESALEGRRDELREEVALRKRQHENQEKARQEAQRERIRRRIETSKSVSLAQPPLQPQIREEEEPSSAALQEQFEPAYFGSHANAAARRRGRSNTPPKALEEAEEDVEPILPVYADEDGNFVPLTQTSSRRPRSVTRRFSRPRSMSFSRPIRPIRTRSIRDSIRNSISLPPVDPLFAVADDQMVQQERENLEKLIVESWKDQDELTAVGRNSDSTLEMTPLGSPRKSEGPLEAQKVAPPPAAQNLPTGPRLVILCVCICTAVFLQALDTTIISTAIPKIVRQFHSLQDVGWYGSGYFLTTCACQLIWGRIYTFYNLKYSYLLSIMIFELGSLICGLAKSSIMLIVGRAIAGLGSAGIFAGSFIIIAFSTPPASRPKYSALLGSMYGVASVVGPLVGGAFSDKVTWRWCFYINLPLGAVALTGILFFLRQPAQNAALRNLPNAEKIKRLDYHGTLVFIGSLVCLFVALEWGGERYDWDSDRIVVLLFFFGLGMVLWVGIQYWKGESGTVPARIIGQRSIWTAAFSCYCMGGSFFIILYYIAIYFQAIKSSTPLKSGIQSLPTLLGLTIGMTIAGHTHKFVKYHAAYMIASAVLATIGTGLISTWTPSTNHSGWIGYQALFGIGQGFGWQQPILIAQAFLEPKDIPIGTALMSGVKLFGGATFISVGSAVFNNRLKKLLAQIPDLDPKIVLAAGASGLEGVIHDEDTLRAVKDAYSDALTMVFHISIVLACLATLGALGVEWKIPEVKKPGGGPPAAPQGQNSGASPAMAQVRGDGSGSGLTKLPSHPPPPPPPPAQTQMARVPQVSGGGVQGYSIGKPVAANGPLERF